MKNLYALDNKHNLIHIENVIKGKKEKFYCCNCENELIPKKGKIIAHHFLIKIKSIVAMKVTFTN